MNDDYMVVQCFPSTNLREIQAKNGTRLVQCLRFDSVQGGAVLADFITCFPIANWWYLKKRAGVNAKYPFYQRVPVYPEILPIWDSCPEWLQGCQISGLTLAMWALGNKPRNSAITHFFRLQNLLPTFTHPALTGKNLYQWFNDRWPYLFEVEWARSYFGRKQQ